MSHVKASLSPDGNHMLLEPMTIDGKLLSSFGARKAKNKYSMPMRLADFERLQQRGLEIDVDGPLSEKLTSLAKRDRTIQYLQAAQALRGKEGTQHRSWSKLLPHQHVGVGYLSITPRALLVYSPRLGKTPTSIVTAELLNCDRILVVCPLTLFGTWRRGIQQWAEDGAQADVVIAHGSPPKGDMPFGRQWVLTNPESISLRSSEWLAWAEAQGIEIMVLDESILYKNHKSKRQQIMVKLGQIIPRVWELTGNPTGRYADQLFGQLQILRPDIFTSYWRFANDWCFVTENPWASEVTGNKDPDGLRTYLRDLMISRTPTDVPVLPELTFDIIEVELSREQEELIDELDLTMSLRNPENPEEPTMLTNVLQLMTRTAQIVSEPSQLGYYDVPSAKAEVAWDIIERSEKPVLVWFQFVESLTAFAQMMIDKGMSVGLIHGGVTDSKRQRTIDRFQAGELNVICVQLQTGKFGLDLTRAKTIIYYDRSFDLDSWIQSTNRGRLINMAQDQVAAGYVLHGGYTDYLVDKILLRKVTSLAQMSLSDLLEVTKSTSTRRKRRAHAPRKQKEATA